MRLQKIGQTIHSRKEDPFNEGLKPCQSKDSARTAQQSYNHDKPPDVYGTAFGPTSATFEVSHCRVEFKL